MSIRDIYFGFPQAAYLLAFLIPLFFLHLYLFYYRRKKISVFASKSILPHLLVPRSFLLNSLKIGAFCLAWIFLCLALMDPQGNLRYFPLSSPHQKPIDFSKRYRPHEVVLLIDTSASMSAVDSPHGMSRLEQAKGIMDDIAAQLKGQTVSLYSFTSVLTPVVPSTHDYLFARLMIKSLNINHGDIGGTNFEKALAQLKEKLFAAATPKLYTLILLSDGGDREVEELRGSDREKALQTILNTLPDSKEFNFRLYTIGMGSNQPSEVPGVSSEGKPVYSKLDPFILEQLAKRNRGIYYAAHDWPAWNLAQELEKQLTDETFVKQTEPMQSLERTVQSAKREELLSDLYYQIPLGLGIVLLLTYLILPTVRRS